MEKKKALGGDPLSWLKRKNKEGKQDNDISDQEKRTHKPLEFREEGVFKTENKKQEERTYEPGNVKEKYRKVVIGEKEPVYNIRSHATKQKENPATIFVVVYTVLLLILGFLVFRDLTKKINKLNTKLSSIEKKIESGYPKYGDANFEDVW